MTTPSAQVTATRPPAAVVRRIVELACRAASVHNTQPWRWQYREGTLDLHTDRTRQLSLEDPDGRNLVISCGVALQHAEASAEALGWRSTVTRLPEGPESTMLARMSLVRGVASRHAKDTLHSIEHRYTDRRRFTSWPVAEESLGHLASVATEWGSRGLAVIDATDRFRVELLVARALQRQSADRTATGEQNAWVDHGPTDGIPSSALPTADQLRVRRPNRFSVGLLEDFDQEVEHSDGLIVLCAATDEPASWLRAGEGLGALWLAATAMGMSVVPLSSVIEVPETRSALQYEVLGGLARPLILVRVGWQAISRGDLPRTARRPVDDVLDLPPRKG